MPALFRSLTGASSAQGILTQNKWSLLDAVQRGGELLEVATMTASQSIIIIIILIIIIFIYHYYFLFWRLRRCRLPLP